MIVFLEAKEKTYLVHVTSFVNSNSHFYLCQKAQIRVLKTVKVFIIILKVYISFANVFFDNLTGEILEYIEIKNYAINLIEVQ